MSDWDDFTEYHGYDAGDPSAMDDIMDDWEADKYISSTPVLQTKQPSISESDIQKVKAGYVEDGNLIKDIFLTPNSFLNASQAEVREALFSILDLNLELKIVHQSENQHDNFALQVYYKEVFIGHIRKRFYDINIDYSSLINSFCFNEGTLKKIFLKFRDGKLTIVEEDELLGNIQLSFETKKNNLIEYFKIELIKTTT